MRKKNAFDQEAIQSLVNLGYNVYTEKDMAGSKSRPDLLAIKNVEVLMIETKSEEEASSDSCLYGSDNIVDWRKYCRTKYPRSIAVWMVHIGGQIKSQLKRLGDKKGDWRIRNSEIRNHQIVPCLICPTLYSEQVKEALNCMRITEFQLLELSATQVLVRLDKKQLLESAQH